MVGVVAMSERRLAVGTRVSRVAGDGRRQTGAVTALQRGLWRVEWDDGTVGLYHKNELKVEMRTDG